MVIVLTLPDPRPGVPDVRTAGRYLAWLGRQQWRTLVIGMSLGTAWTMSQAMVPWLVGRTIDEGVAAGDARALLTWCAALLAVALFQTGSGALRHRFAVWNWLQAALRTQQLIGHHAAGAGTALAARKTTGDVVSGVANDAGRIGAVFDVSQRFVGSVLAFVAVTVLLLRIDVGLGLLVLIGVPALTTSLALVVRPLQRRQNATRDAEGRLTTLGADTVAGLRVLRGIGGEDQFLARYTARSQAVRDAGVGAAGVQATLDAAQVLLPGAFVATLTWLGAHATLDGRISTGQLVTLYGYAAFLVLPLGTATETLGKAVRARVAAGRVVEILRIRPRHAATGAVAVAVAVAGGVPDRTDGVIVADPASGLRLRAGELTALVAPVPDEAARVAYRLARLEDDLPAGEAGEDPGDAATDGTVAAPRLAGVGIDTLPIAWLRRRILVSEAEPRLFTGTLRAQVDPHAAHADADVLAALDVADGHDVLDAVPEGLDGRVEERGRSLSGGQRQRVALARAVLAGPQVLVLVEPTSAVDAHTEARIAQRLVTARSGRTTLVTTASPLLLDRADAVAFLVGGRVVATGTHRELLRTVPAYRDTVIRGEAR